MIAMAKSKVLATIIILALLSTITADSHVVEVAKANFYIPPYETAITIVSLQNTTYNQNTILLNFTLESNGFGWYWYGLDNGNLTEINVTTVSKVPLPIEYQNSPSTNYRYTRVANTELYNLTEGMHTVTVVELSSSRQIMTYANVTFKIDTATNDTLGPLNKWQSQYPSSSHIYTHSPQNSEVVYGSVFVNFTVYAFVGVYDVGYSIDDGPIKRVFNLTKTGEEISQVNPIFPNVYYLGNVTLAGLNEGKHSMTIYQGYQYPDRYDEFTHTIVNFTISTTTPSPSPSITPTPTLTPNPSFTISPSPSVPEFPSGILLLAMIGILLAVAFVVRRKSQIKP
jgi:hypothetical protein